MIENENDEELDYGYVEDEDAEGAEPGLDGEDDLDDDITEVVHLHDEPRVDGDSIKSGDVAQEHDNGDDSKAAEINGIPKAEVPNAVGVES